MTGPPLPQDETPDPAFEPLPTGWFTVTRAFFESSLLQSFDLEQQAIAERICFLYPQFVDKECWHGGNKFVVQRGSFFHAVDTLAKQMRVSSKRVRTVMEKLEIAGWISRRRAVKSAGKCPIITTIRFYEISQSNRERGGKQTGNPGANERAMKGQSTGNEGAAKELREPKRRREKKENKSNTGSAIDFEKYKQEVSSGAL